MNNIEIWRGKTDQRTDRQTDSLTNRPTDSVEFASLLVEFGSFVWYPNIWINCSIIWITVSLLDSQFKFFESRSHLGLQFQLVELRFQLFESLFQLANKNDKNWQKLIVDYQFFLSFEIQWATDRRSFAPTILDGYMMP